MFGVDSLVGDRLIGAGVAAVVHGLAFLIGGAALVTPAEYGVEAGGGIEVHLVAALPGGIGMEPGDGGAPTVEPEPVPPLVQAAQPEPVPESVPEPGVIEPVTAESIPIAEPQPPESDPEPEDVAALVPREPARPALIQQEAPTEQSVTEPTVKEPVFDVSRAAVVTAAAPLGRPYSAAPPKGGVSGDGSSPVPGNDPTTLHAAGGAWTGAKPSHLRNPAPRYPLAARQLGQEGLVMVRADVDQRGRPTRVSLEQTSGHALLDDSAIEAIRRWRFHPARVGGMAISSVVEIPIRFQLREPGPRTQAVLSYSHPD